MTSDNIATDETPLSEELDPNLVEQYLRDHPDFFKHRLDVITELKLPHGESGAVSLVERQVSLLRERNIEMRDRLASMTAHANDNDTLFDGTRATVLAMLDTRNATDIVAAFSKAIKAHFDVAYCCLLWLAEDSALPIGCTQADQASRDILTPILKRHRPLSGTFRQDEMQALFKMPKGEGSAALAPLVRNDQLLGVIAVGSSDATRYRSSDGTLFIEHIAEVIMRLPVLAHTHKP